MSAGLEKTPFPVTYRELWLPGGINGASQPTSKNGGHPLTLTNALKRTSVDGLRMARGVAGAEMHLGAVGPCNFALGAGNGCAWHIRFKLVQAVGAGGFLYIAAQNQGANDKYELLFWNDGKIKLQHVIAADTKILLASVRDSWAAGEIIDIIVSIADDGAQVNGRLIINGGAAVTAVDAGRNALNNTGDLVIGANAVGGSGVGFDMLAFDHFSDTLTAAGEIDLYNGVPPADVVFRYLFDEGRGSTDVNRANPGVNDGIIGAACIWQFGQVRQPVLSPNGISGYGLSSAGVDISGDFTVVWAGKMKSTYNDLSDDHYLWELYLTNTDNYTLLCNLITHDLQFIKITGGGSAFASYAYHPAIDDYAVIICTHRAGILTMSIYGYPVATAALANAMPAGAAVAYIGAEDSPAYYDVSKPLRLAIPEGAFSAKQTIAYSRWLKDGMNLPVSI